MLRTHSQHPECVRIWKRLYKHCDELFTFLDDPAVPADNNGTERDIRSLAAARSDGGTHRADWGAAAFARLKSVIVAGMKNQSGSSGMGSKWSVPSSEASACPFLWLRPRIPANRRPASTGPSPGTLSTLTSWASTARPRPSTGSGPGHHVHLPDLSDHPCTASSARLR